MNPVLFWAISAMVLIGALLVVRLGNIFHAGLSLVATFFGVAALYATLDAHFLSAVQVLIYIGAISIIIMFAVMLTHHIYERDTPVPLGRRAGAAFCSLAFAAIAITAVWHQGWNVLGDVRDFKYVEIQEIGRLFPGEERPTCSPSSSWASCCWWCSWAPSWWPGRDVRQHERGPDRPQPVPHRGHPPVLHRHLRRAHPQERGGHPHVARAHVQRGQHRPGGLRALPRPSRHCGPGHGGSRPDVRPLRGRGGRAEVTIGVAIVLSVYRNFRNINVEEVDLLKW